LRTNDQLTNRILKIPNLMCTCQNITCHTAIKSSTFGRSSTYCDIN